MQKYTNKGSVPWYPKEPRTPCKNAVNDSTIASSISWWQGWHLFHCISPMPLQDRTIFTDKQHLATDLARLPRTVSPGEQWCKSICARRAQFHVPLGPQTFQLPQSLQDIGAIVPRAQGRSFLKHNLQRMNATPCPQKQNMEQSQNTISKKCMQDHIHRRKMSTALL